MTKYFCIEGRFDSEMLQRLVVFANDNNDNDWEISINSSGGKQSVYQVAKRIIDSKEKLNPGSVTVVAVYICSSGFCLFAETECAKKMYFGAYGIAHSSFAAIDTTGNMVARYSLDKALVQTQKECFPAEVEIMSKLLNKKELALFEKGEDVLLPFSRLKRMFPDAEII